MPYVEEVRVLEQDRDSAVVYQRVDPPLVSERGCTVPDLLRAVETQIRRLALHPSPFSPRNRSKNSPVARYARSQLS